MSALSATALRRTITRSGVTRWQRRAPVVFTVVLAMHLALAWWLIDASTKAASRESRSAPVARVALRWIAAPAAAPAPVAVPTPPRAGSPPTPTPTSTPTPTPTRVAPLPSRERTTSQPPDATAITRAPAEAAAQPDPPASTAPLAPSLLDTDATRRAIRQSAREPSLGEQRSRSRDEPDRLGAQGRLADGVKSAGKGDCMKGDFAGGGMGLLSLPFLAVAAARGDCAK